MAEEQSGGECFQRGITFRFGDCCSRGHASLHSMLKLFSELAGDDCESRGLGRETLLGSGLLFLLSRMSLRVERAPVIGETVAARTWETETSGPYFRRKYEMLDGTGKVLVSGSGLWFLTDPATRKIMRPSSLDVGTRRREERRSGCQKRGKLRLPETMPSLGSRPVYRSDIDFNNHVNNAVYGAIAEDFLPEAYWSRELRCFDIDYNSETKPGETLELFGEGSEAGFVMKGISGAALRFCCEFGF